MEKVKVRLSIHHPDHDPVEVPADEIPNLRGQGLLVEVDGVPEKTGDPAADGALAQAAQVPATAPSAAVTPAAVTPRAAATTPPGAQSPASPATSKEN